MKGEVDKKKKLLVCLLLSVHRVLQLVDAQVIVCKLWLCHVTFVIVINVVAAAVVVVVLFVVAVGCS